jgi:hypothetical protein
MREGEKRRPARGSAPISGVVVFPVWVAEISPGTTRLENHGQPTQGEAQRLSSLTTVAFTAVNAHGSAHERRSGSP